MYQIFLKNYSKNILGDKILETFKENITTELNFDKFSNENNIFIFNTDFYTDEFQENLAENICTKLDETFELVQKIVKFLIETEKKAKFIFFTTNSKLSAVSDFPVSPIYEEAINTFVKSLTKELNPFNLTFNVLCIESISELMEKEELRAYRQKTKYIAQRKSPAKLDNLMIVLKELIESKTTLFSGTIFTIGEGVYY